FHVGKLASADANSPHLRAAQIKSRVYVAGAIEDASFPDDMKARLAEALVASGVDHTIETYQARHGWALRDTPVYDEVQAARHFTALFALLDATLGP
ncbi:MAG: dienelactone hydrolase family protein, partial [Proteobacteria bacterium]|nr:dienelactone hydrolase family protein [Pseudomonadota bacterium]